jgi:hypothetical protein
MTANSAVLRKPYHRDVLARQIRLALSDIVAAA